MKLFARRLRPLIRGGSAVFLVLAGAFSAMGQTWTYSTNTFPSFYASNAGVITVNFTGNANASAALQTASSNPTRIPPTITPADADTKYEGSASILVLDSNNTQIGSLSVTTTNNPQVQGNGISANITGTASYMDYTTKGGSPTTTQYSENYTCTISSQTTTANNPFSGKFSISSSTFPGSILVGDTYTYSGTYTFYAPAAGTYTFQEPNQSWSLDTGGSIGSGVRDADSSSISITSVTEAAVSKLPSGSLTATKNQGGVGGVTLQWTITPPSQ